MKKKKLILLTFVFMMLSTACGAGIDLPFRTEMKTGPTLSEPIQVESPQGQPPTDVTLSFGAGTLKILPNPGQGFIRGTATYNVKDFKPEIINQPGIVKIKQGNFKLNAVPKVNQRIKNEWSLAFSNNPMDLTIKSGGYTGKYEFGGLGLTELHISDGAANVDLSFSTPNPADMHAFRYETGASNITMDHLGNANFQTMLFESGGGNYHLDFSGMLRRNASIFIETGLSRLVITVPTDTAATAQFEGPLSRVSAKGAWQKSGEDYIQHGSGPQLTFTIETKAGTVTLQNP